MSPLTFRWHWLSPSSLEHCAHLATGPALLALSLLPPQQPLLHLPHSLGTSLPPLIQTSRLAQTGISHCLLSLSAWMSETKLLILPRICTAPAPPASENGDFILPVTKAESLAHVHPICQQTLSVLPKIRSRIGPLLTICTSASLVQGPITPCPPLTALLASALPPTMATVIPSHSPAPHLPVAPPWLRVKAEAPLLASETFQDYLASSPTTLPAHSPGHTGSTGFLSLGCSFPSYLHGSRLHFLQVTPQTSPSPGAFLDHPHAPSSTSFHISPGCTSPFLFVYPISPCPAGTVSDLFTAKSSTSSSTGPGHVFCE